MATTAQRNEAYTTASDERDLANAEHLTRADSFAGKPLPLFPRAESQQSALGTHARRNVVAREGLRARA